MGAAFCLAEGLKEERDVLEPGDLFLLERRGENIYNAVRCLAFEKIEPLR